MGLIDGAVEPCEQCGGAPTDLISLVPGVIAVLCRPCYDKAAEAEQQDRMVRNALPGMRDWLARRGLAR